MEDPVCRRSEIAKTQKMREAAMDKLDAVLLYFAVDHMCASQAFDKTSSDLHIEDERVGRLLVLLRKLDESSEGLEALPEPERSEIVCSATRLCGFVDPTEARGVIAIVLDAIEMQNPILGEAASEGLGSR
jgi:hypothetical protein